MVIMTTPTIMISLAELRLVHTADIHGKETREMGWCDLEGSCKDVRNDGTRKVVGKALVAALREVVVK